MIAKLIFYESSKLGREVFNFCPLVKWGCSKCPFGELGCVGVADESVIAYQLSKNNGQFELKPIG